MPCLTKIYSIYMWVSSMKLTLIFKEFSWSYRVEWVRGNIAFQIKKFWFFSGFIIYTSTLAHFFGLPTFNHDCHRIQFSSYTNFTCHCQTLLLWVHVLVKCLHMKLPQVSRNKCKVRKALNRDMIIDSKRENKTFKIPGNVVLGVVVGDLDMLF